MIMFIESDGIEQANFFSLIASDALAPQYVRKWTSSLQRFIINSADKILSFFFNNMYMDLICWRGKQEWFY